MKNRIHWSINDGNSFEVSVRLSEENKNVALEIWDCGKTEKNTWSFSEFLELGINNPNEIIYYLGKDVFLEIQSQVRGKLT